MNKLLSAAALAAVLAFNVCAGSGEAYAKVYSDISVKLDAEAPSQKLLSEVMLPYQYDELSDQAKKCYLDIRKAILAHKNSVKISSRISEKTLLGIADIINSQDPLIFEDAAVEFNDISTDNAYARITYSYTKGVSDSTLKQTLKEADMVIASFLPDFNEYDKFTAIHDHIVQCTEYDESGSKTFIRSVYGSLVPGRAVSEGYAYAFQFICIKAGLTSITVSGTDADGNPHTWNKVKLGEEWYNIDCSQDDVTSSYDLFMVNDEAVKQLFTENDGADYPEASDNSMAYKKKILK